MKIKTMLRAVVVIVIAVFTKCGTSRPALDPEQQVQRFMQENNIPGMFVGVVKNDSVIFKYSSGFADVSIKKPITSTSCMELGSISKAFTAEVILQLYREHRIDLEDSITKFLSNAPATWSGITINHLLSHTSGIQNYLLDPRFRATDYFAPTANSDAEHFFNSIIVDSLIAMFYTLPVEFPPGSSWSYSNTGYILLGKIAEQVTGKSIFRLVDEYLTRPLSLNQTRENEKASASGCLSNGYYEEDGVLKESRILTSNYAHAAGAWSSTGEDMIKYIKAIHRKSLAGDQFKPRNDSLPFTYYSGRFHAAFHGLEVIAHGGGTPGFSSSWVHVPEKGISIIVLMNRQDYAAVVEIAWDVLSYFERSLAYPVSKINDKESKIIARDVLRFVSALKSDSAFPVVLSHPLKVFLNTENGRGFWKWYFSRGFPLVVDCVDKEIFPNRKLFRFRLSAEKAEYRLSILTDSHNKWIQIRWW